MASFLILLSTLLCCAGVFWLYWQNGFRSVANPSLAMAAYSVVIGLLAANGAFLNEMRLPPPMFLAMAPMLLFAIGFGLHRAAADPSRQNLALLALISTVRLPVEVALHALSDAGLVPVQMTWSGTNFDVFSGITAPVVAWLVYSGRMPRTALVVWNLVCLGLLLNIVITGILSAPFPFQALNFDRPNIGVLQYPYALLPVVIVPTVLFTHVKSLRILLGKPVRQAVAA